MRRFQSSTVNSVPSTSFARTCLYRRLGRRFGLDLKPVNGFVRQGLDDLLGLPDIADQPVGYVLPEPFGPLASQCLEREYLVRIRAEPDASLVPRREPPHRAHGVAEQLAEHQNRDGARIVRN